MTAQRPMIVRQKEELDEDGYGHFWFTVSAGNAETILTSKMYRERWRAVRAARALIARISPVSVTFRYWTGPTPEQRFRAEVDGRTLRQQTRVVVERIRHDEPAAAS